MKRIIQTPRKDWTSKLNNVGFHFHSIDDQGNDISGSSDKFIYWREDVAYGLTNQEVENLYDAAKNLQDMCLFVVDDIIKKGNLGELGINTWAQEHIANSFKRNDLHLYGRFDFCMNLNGDIKLLEYNADTPTAIIESAVAQWDWKNDVHPKADQYNSLHEELLNRIKFIKESYGLNSMHFACLTESQEDTGNLEYLEACAKKIGLSTLLMDMSDIGVSNLQDGSVQFIDRYKNNIEAIFKLYPWEWMVEDDFRNYIPKSNTKWLEPMWKMLLSNKAILPMLWRYFPNHPNLLPAFFDAKLLEGSDWVKKPFLSREGCNIEIHQNEGTILKTKGIYDESKCIYQKYNPLPAFESPENTGWLGKYSHMYPVMGAWVVGNEPAGLGIERMYLW